MQTASNTSLSFEILKIVDAKLQAQHIAFSTMFKESISTCERRHEAIREQLAGHSSHMDDLDTKQCRTVGGG